MSRTTCRRTTVKGLGLALSAGLTAAVIAATASPAVAGIPQTWTQDDPAGDVVFTGERGLDRAERRSIDATSVATYDGSDQTQVNVRIREVTESPEFDQDVRLTFANRRGDTVGSVRFSPSPDRQDSGVAVLGSGADREVCRGLSTTYFETAEGDTTITPIPDRCVPTARVRVKLVTSTVDPDGGTTYSRDRVTSDGPVRVRPTDPAVG